jgi:hypothetical protein
MSKFTKFIKHPLLFIRDTKLLRQTSNKKSKHNQYNNIEVFSIDFKNTPIGVYFYGSLNSYYQLQQWIKPLLELHQSMPFVFIVRDIHVYRKLIEDYQHPTVYLKTLNNLTDFYQNNHLKIILYVNNGVKNFQSLMYTNAYHIHINHGESEKESMYSNQAKAYDYILTVGNRAIDRYKEHLLNFDSQKFIKIGRPQLDYIEKTTKINNLEQKKVILYAPTWEATHESMNYSSVSKYGEILIKFLLLKKEYLIIYKPHSAIGTKDSNIKRSHLNIIKMLETYQDGYVLEEENIHNIFPIIDFAFFDNTSVMIDYLYFNKPAAYLKIKEDNSLKHILKGIFEINENNFSEILTLLNKELKIDSLSKERNKIKYYYLDDYQQGESTKKFIHTLQQLIKKRDNEINTKSL